MREIFLDELIDIKKEDYVYRFAELDDVSTEIAEDCTIYYKGVPILFYINMQKKTELLDIKIALKNVKYKVGTRSGGLVSRSRIFGYAPRNALKGHTCRAADMSSSSNKLDVMCSSMLTSLASFVSDSYKRVSEVYGRHINEVNKILSEYRMGETPFTSGIINYNNELQYHLDSGNIKDVFSNMIVFKDGVHGGQLVLPELGVRLRCDDMSLVIFDGQKYIHGVSRIKKEREDAFRISVVYYSLKDLWRCLPIREEYLLEAKKRYELENSSTNNKDE